jgi:putative phage-type endonuclease
MLTPQQIEERKTGLGSSDAAIVCGISTYMTPVHLYLEKIGMAPPRQEMNERQYWGHVQEPIIAAEYEKQTGKTLLEVSTVRCKKNPFMLAHVDRMIEGENVAVEIKNVGADQAYKWGEEGTDDIPEQYLIQVAHQAIVANLDYVVIAALIGGNSFKTYRYERNATLEKRLIEIERDFWIKHIEAKIAPETKNYDDVRLLYPADNNQEAIVDSDSDVISHIEKYKFITAEIKDMEFKLSEQKAAIAKVIGFNSVLKASGGDVLATFKTSKTNRFDSKAFQSAHPEIYANFIKQNEHRTLRIK